MHAKGRTIARRAIFAVTLWGILGAGPLHRPPEAAAQALRSPVAPLAIGADLPITFEPNQGQTAETVRFLGRANGYRLFIEPDETIIALNGSPQRGGRAEASGSAREAPRAIRIELLGAAPAQRIEAGDPLPTRINYLVGNDPAAWHAGIPTYRTVTQHGVWPGIDLVYRDDADHGIESDFIVAPGADAQLIRLAVLGGDRLSVDRDGNLVITAGQRGLTLLKPGIYQELAGRRFAIEGRYVIDGAIAAGRGGQRVRFEIASYDRRRTLVIDPQLTLVYSTYLGGSGFDDAFGVAVDFEHSAYIAGATKSADFPVNQGQLRDSEDAFVAKFSPDGKSLVYATFIGGTGGSGSTQAFAIAEDGYNAYITGVTDTKSFPTTQHAYQRNAPGGGGHPFVSELSRNGSSFVFSTYFGSTDSHKCDSQDPGVDWGTGIALDGNSEPFVTGTTCSVHFPVWRAFQFPIQYSGLSYVGNQIDLPAAFVFHLDPYAQKPVFSTYLGGAGFTRANAIALSANLAVPYIYVTGSTSAQNFPVKNAFQPHRSGYSDAFITRFSTDGQSLVYSTYLGGDNADEGRGIAVDRTEHAYVIGNYSSFHFPITHNLSPHEEPVPGMFIAKLAQDGHSLLYCDSLGGEFANESGNSIAVFHGFAYVTGTINGRFFPVVNAFQDSPPGGRDVFVSKISQDGNSFSYSTYLGGNQNDEGNAIAVGPGGDAYVTGRTASPNFPTHNPFQPALSGSGSAFVTRLQMPN